MSAGELEALPAAVMEAIEDVGFGAEPRNYVVVGLSASLTATVEAEIEQAVLAIPGANACQCQALDNSTSMSSSVSNASLSKALVVVDGSLSANAQQVLIGLGSIIDARLLAANATPAEVDELHRRLGATGPNPGAPPSTANDKTSDSDTSGSGSDSDSGSDLSSETDSQTDNDASGDDLAQVDVGGAPILALVIEGMMCQNSCGSTVANAIRAVEGVTAVAVSYADTRAIVLGTANQDLDKALIIEAVEDVGFDAAPLDTLSVEECRRLLTDALAAGGPGVHGPKRKTGDKKRSKAKTKTKRKTTSRTPDRHNRRRQSKSPRVKMRMCDYVVSGIVCASCAGQFACSVLRVLAIASTSVD